MTDYSLRPYQTTAVSSILGAWQRDRSTLLVMATGTGKTRVLSEILRQRAGTGRALVLAHRDELLTQASRAIQRDAGLSVDLEQADSYADVRTLFGDVSEVVVASVQTLHAGRRRRWPSGHFSTVVVDEAHHAAAKSYRGVLSHFSDAKVLGVTATPDRGDGIGMGRVFASVAFSYDIRTAIAEGYLCKIRQMYVACDDLSLEDVRSTCGELSASDLQQALTIDMVLHQIATPLVREAGDRPTVVFTAGVDQAHALAGVIGTHVGHDRVGVVDGKTPREERRRVLGAYQSGAIQYVVNVGVLTEGFDAPETACIAMARPTKSRALYAQMVGRGTRLKADGGDCLVLDFVGNSGRHRLVTAADVLAGKELPEDVAAAVREATEGGMDVDEALEAAEAAQMERIAREKAEARRRKAKAKVRYQSRSVDPFSVLDVEAPESGGRAATAAQRDYLDRLGVELDHAPSATEARALLDRISDRRKRGLCSYKQAKLLIKNGLPSEVSFAQASAMITEIADNNWRVPAGMLERYTMEVIDE